MTLRLRLALPVVLFAALALAGCRNPFHSLTGTASAPVQVATGPVAVVKPVYQPVPIDTSKPLPNEAGEVPILEYHQLVPDGVTPHAYQYPETEFRNDMEKLYSLGYRPINLSDFVHGVIDIPAGTSPFIITFDDSLPGQVDMTPDGKIDPNCAAGILSSIHAEHPDFALKGTFFILPRPGSNDYFFQAGLSNQKLQWLVQNGFELGNHTVHHQLGMNHFTDQRVQMEFAVAAKMITDVMPGYNVQTLALPYGVFPKNKKLVQEGAYNGLAYKNICALAAGAGPSPSPMSAKFNPYHIPREIPGSQPLTIRWWMNYLEHNPKEKYVSDGDPHTYTVPSDLVSKIDQAKITANGYHLRVIQPSIPTVSVATPRASTAAPKKPHK